MKKLFGPLLCLALCLCLTAGALASGGPDQNYGGENEENSAIVVKNGVLSENADAGSCELAPDGEVSGSGISGIYLTGANDRSNGLYLAEDDDAAAFTVGGARDNYDVDGVGSFNSVIDVAGPEDEDPNAEDCYGVGITSGGGLLTLDNIYVHTRGYRASALYTLSGTPSETNLVVKDSVLRADGAADSFIPDFKLLVGSARATLFLGQDIWLYNSAFLSRDWGALSHDTNTTDIRLYAVNTYAETYDGGYCLYALNGTANYLYGCKFVSAQYGMFVMGAGEAYLDGLDAADGDALAYADGEDFSDSLTGDGSTLVAGRINAVVFHVNGNVMDPGVLTVADAKLSTLPEDVVSDYGDALDFDFDSYLLSPALYGESWFYLENCYGSLIATRSHGGDIRFEPGAVLTPSNGVLVQTLVGYDSMAGSIYRDSGDTRELKDVTVTIDTPVQGDILHQDYQRDMLLNVNADYDGRVTTGSITAWNGLWTAENLQALLARGGHTGDFDVTDETVANIRSCLVREEDTAAYTDVFGVYMTVGAGATWTAEGESSVLSLELAEGAAVKAEKIYVDCSFGADGYLDPATGTEVTSLSAGTYKNVVLVGASVPEDALPVYETDGGLFVRLDDLLNALGA